MPRCHTPPPPSPPPPSPVVAVATRVFSLKRCTTGRLLLRLHQFMSCGAWVKASAATSQVLGKYRAFARRVRDEVGAGHVQQLTLLTSRLFNREILPQDYALCATRLLRAHPQLLPPLLQLLSHPAMPPAPTASSFKRSNRCFTLPPPWEDAGRPLGPPRLSASLSCSPSSAAAAPSARQPFQLLTNARNRVPSAARAIVAGDLYALGCAWGSIMLDLPPDVQLSATRSLSQFVVSLNPN
jgi:hypothetical protein